MGIKIIVTGSTGMVGEGVLLTALAHPDVTEVLMVNRKHFDLEHQKLRELLVPDFMRLDDYTSELAGYDACFYCAGISSVGLSEEKYNYITYDTTLYFAKKILSLNQNIVFNFVSGRHTDGTEKGKVMWARVKGKTENALMAMPFKGQYNFRPGAMSAVAGQNNSKLLYKIIVAVFSVIVPKQVCSIGDIGLAMINLTTKGYPEQVLEVKDIKILAAL